MRALLGKRRALAIAAIVLAAGLLAVVLRTRADVALLRGYEGAGTVTGQHDVKGRAVILELDGGGQLPVLAISSRIDAGDRVEKRAGELSYVINGERVNPVGTVIGSMIFFWIFLPILALLPLLILVRTREA